MLAELKKIYDQTQDTALHYHLSFLDNVADALITTDKDFTIISWNKASEEIHGIDAKDAIGRNAINVLRYEYLDGDRETAIQAIMASGTWRGLVKYKRPDGKIIFLEAQVNRVLDQNGVMLGFVGVNRDVTESYRTKIFLTDYISILDSVEETYIVIDREMKVVFSHFKESVKNFYKFAYDVGEHILDRIPERRRQVIADAAQRAFAGETVSYEITSPLSPGTHLHVYYFPLKTDTGRTSHICVLVKDISIEKSLEITRENQRTAEEKLFQSRQVFEEFMEKSPLMAWIADTVGTMHYMNPLYLHSFGFSKTDIGRMIGDLFPPDLAQTQIAHNLKVMQSGRPIETIEKTYVSYGSTLTHKVYRFPIIFNNTTMIAGWAVNLTDQISMQEQILTLEKIKAKQIIESIIDTKEGERSQLSQLLRDNINQILASCKLMLESSNFESNSSIASAYRYIEDAIVQIKDISDNLNPSIVEELGFEPALQNLADQAKQMIEISFQLSQETAKKLSQKLKLGIFRIIQNYATLSCNKKLIQHAKATISESMRNIIITLHCDSKATLKKVQSSYEWNSIVNRTLYFEGSISFPQTQIQITLPPII